jgi:hypothetical protein
MDRMDHTLDEIAAAYNGQGGIESFKTFLERYPTRRIRSATRKPRATTSKP